MLWIVLVVELYWGVYRFCFIDKMGSDELSEMRIGKFSYQQKFVENVC